MGTCKYHVVFFSLILQFSECVCVLYRSGFVNDASITSRPANSKRACLYLLRLLRQKQKTVNGFSFDVSVLFSKGNSIDDVE